MKKVLFIDRDGTLVIEPPEDYQLDSLEKLEFYPGVFQSLSKIAIETDYELVMVTNQDGLGTFSFPEESFWPAHNKIIKAFENEAVVFSEILIDRSFPNDNSANRKPRTGMLGKYIHGNYNLKESYVIGDRISDIELAENLRCRSIFIGKNTEKNTDLITKSWEEIYKFLKSQPRKAYVSRKTHETNITVELNIDGSGKADIDTGIGFFNHMLVQIAKHGKIDLNIKAIGDLETGEHHTIEDVAVCLGEAFVEALGSKKSIKRYGFLLPMDDSLSLVAMDFGGRPWLTWNVIFNREKIGDMPTEMFMHFFKSFSDTAKCNLNIKAEGENEHHKIEAIFKAFAKCISQAVSKTNDFSVPSTKGSL